MTTCHHCYWLEEYNGGDFSQIYQMYPFVGNKTKNCLSNLNLVPTIHCDGDCFTHEFVTNPEWNLNGQGKLVAVFSNIP